MELDSRLKEWAEELGASFYGVADLSPAHDAIVEQGGPMVEDFPRAISVGVALQHAIVDHLPQRDQPAVAMTYRHIYALCAGVNECESRERFLTL